MCGPSAVRRRPSAVSETRLALRVEAQPAAVAREADAARVDADVPAARAAPRDARGGVQSVQPVGLDAFELQGWEVEEVRWRR